VRLRGSLHPTNPHRVSQVHAHEPVYSASSRPKDGRHARGWIAWAAASAACVLTAALAVAFLARQAGQGNTKPSVEIYFKNPSDIATWTGTRSVAFSFVVHNLASKTYHYRYVVYVTGEKNQNKLAADKVLALGPQQRITIRQTLKPPSSARFRVSVSLAGARNVIFFWTQAPSLQSGGSGG
jgi:hypothetical protein